MASQQSVYNEERDILRRRAWELRIQETNQAKELNPDNVPLFGQPYKTNKGDELSNRIQRMLGSYEDVNTLYPFASEPSPIPTCGTLSRSDRTQPNTDKPANPPFHSTSSPGQKALCGKSYSPQPMTMSTPPFSPTHHGHPTTFSNASQPSHSSTHPQIKSEDLSDYRDGVGLSQDMFSSDVKPPSFLRSSDHENTDTDSKEFRTHHLQGCLDPPADGSGSMDVSTFNPKQSPKDVPLLPQGNKGSNTLPAQSFPSLLSSKPPSVVLTQKPTAYVRPMDGQDHVVSESPVLKPSPEPYVPLPELISKSDLGKTKVLPQFLETRADEAQCVEDILREMTHSWPPLLAGLHTPRTDEPPKPLLQAKEAQQSSWCAGQKNHGSSPADPPQLIEQNSPSSFQAAHSRGEASASSSDSESSSRSESDSEGITEEPRQPIVNHSIKTEPDAPAVSRDDWQLGKYIRSRQQSAAHTQPPPPTQSFKHSSVQVVESKPQLASQQKELTDNLGKPQLYHDSPRDNCDQHRSSADMTSWSSSSRNNTHSSKPAKAACSEHTAAAALQAVKCEEVVAFREKDPCFTDRPKVKTKTVERKKSNSSGDAKRDSKRTSKHTPFDKRKAKSEPEPDFKGVPCGRCGVSYPNPCSCPAQRPAGPQQTSQVPPVIGSSSKPKSLCQKGKEIPHKTSPKHSEKSRHAAKRSGDPHRAPRCLLVRIDLSLLPRVPHTSRKHQQPAGSTKRSAAGTERDGGDSGAPTTHKHSKKTLPREVEVDIKTVPRKKQRLENKNTSSARASAEKKVRSHKLSQDPVTDGSSSRPTEGQQRNQAKKVPDPLQTPLTAKDPFRESKSHAGSSVESQQKRKEAMKGKDTGKPKRSSGKQTGQPRSEKKPPKSSPAIPSSSQPAGGALTNRPLLRHEDRQHPVKHYIKEAKKLKHKADAESDKFIKAFNYLDAAMYFVESGIVMEKDPQISMSSYTMFAETVELLKFVLKLKSSGDPSAPPSEKDFLALCLKCQSLLQMAMFRHKHKTALKYSKTLTDHFSSSTQRTPDGSVLTPKVSGSPSPMSSLPSPASTPGGSAPGQEPVGSSLAMEQVAFSYVNITMLFLSAHDIWEQAQELAQQGTGMLTELDSAVGPLTLASSMSSMVRYARQGVHWLRLAGPKVK